MNMLKLTIIAGLLTTISADMFAESASSVPGTANLPIETHLRVDVEKDTDEVVFVTDVTDPDVVTKVYDIKNVSPWVIREYVLNAIGGSGGTLSNPGTGAKMIDENFTKVEAMEFNDGSGVLIVSAEEYKFKKRTDGSMSIDELVASLDLPDVVNSSGSSVIMYFPITRVAPSLKTLLENVGALKNDTVQGVDRARTVIATDTELNALVILTPRFQKKEIMRMIREYDQPLPEPKITYTIYEVDVENDDKVGHDFQAWKNGMGADRFSAGANYSSGWSGLASTGGPSINKWQSVDFIQFSPQWSTQYLDFLQSNGHAKVVTSGMIEVVNGTTGEITKSTYVPYFSEGDPLDGSEMISGDFSVWSTVDNGGVSGATAATSIAINYKVGTDNNGTAITAGAPINSGEMTVTKTTRGNTSLPTLYSLNIISGNGYFEKNGVNIGKTAEVYGFYETVTLISAAGVVSTLNTVSWQNTSQYTIDKGTKRTTSILDYGFTMSVTPSVCTESTIMSISMTNKSLLGYQSDGTPRVVQSDIKTDVMVSNSGRKFAIGGITNSSVVKVATKVPFLGDIPGIGWLFKTEYDAIKETKMIAVIECELNNPAAPLTGGILESIGEVEGAIKDPVEEMAK